MSEFNIKDYEVFFRKKFREDLEAGFSISEDYQEQIKAWLASLANLEDLSNKDNWLKIAKDTGLTIEEINSLIRPLYYIAMASNEENCEINDIVEELKSNNLFPSDVDHEKLAKVILELTPKIKDLYLIEMENSAPKLPINYIEGLSSKIIYVCDYGNDIDYKNDNIEEYAPSIPKFYPRISLELEFQEGDNNRVGMILNKNQAEDFMKRLEVAIKRIDSLENNKNS